MPSWRSAELSSCSGRRLPRVSRGLRCALFGLSLASSLTVAQALPQQAAEKATSHRTNELTLAGLHPGRDRLVRAVRLYHAYETKGHADSQTVWLDLCHKQVLAVEFDSEGKIQVIRAAHVPWTADCLATPPSSWKTGRGLRVDDPVARLVALYGPPNSKSSSTRDGQPLELWYYAFDGARPDVPQVMEVLFITEKEGQPGRVIEMTLAATRL